MISSELVVHQAFVSMCKLAPDPPKYPPRTGGSYQLTYLFADIETDKATLAWENQDEGFIAKILKPSGSKDIAVGTPCAVLVEEEDKVAAFKDYRGEGGGEQNADASAGDAAPAQTGW